MNPLILRQVQDAIEDDDDLDEEARKEWGEIETQGALTTESLVSKSTTRQRERYWSQWEKYCAKLKVEPSHVWVALVKGKTIRRNPADRIFARFLRKIVQDSYVTRLSLGTEEYVQVRRIQSAKTMKGLWKTLRGVAQIKVFDPLIRESPESRFQYTVTGRSGERTDTPMWAITRFITDTLPDLENLTREQTFVKKEMTEEDVILHLYNLWSRASDIPCSPGDRVAYHTAVLILACGGFRSGTTLGMLYSDVQFTLVRNPQDRSQAKLVAHITIRQNKQKLNIIRENQKHLIKFSVTTVPSKMLCIARLLFARALADKAFKDEFNSLEQLLSQAKFEHVEQIHLEWKESHRALCIIPITYHLFWTIWNRVVLVTGARDIHQRPYSLRVGGGGRLEKGQLDGTLTSAMRNYLMSHSSQVFEQSYQPQHFRDDVAHLCFGAKAGDHTALFKLLQNSSLERDMNAPLYATPEDYAMFEKRQDLTALRKLYHKAVQEDLGGADSDHAKSIASQIQWIRTKLASMVVEQRRQQYFYDADRLRAQGLSTEALVQSQQRYRASFARGSVTAQQIGELFEPCFQIDDPKLKDWRDYVSLTDVLKLYLLGHGREVEQRLLEARPAGKATESAPAKARLGNEYRCLLCSENEWFFSRYTLSRHNTNIHYRQGKPGNQFTSRFRCPECRSTAQKDVWIENVMHWSNHTELFHSTKCSPIPPAGARDDNRVWLAKCAPGTENRPPGRGGMKLGKGMCYICLNEFSQAGGFYNHWAKHKAAIFQKSFPCPECLREKNQAVLIDGAEAWYNHLVEAHEGGGPFGRLQHPECVPKKRSRAEQERSALAQKLQQQRGRRRTRPSALQRGREVASDECLGKEETVGDITLIDPQLHSEHSAQR